MRGKMGRGQRISCNRTLLKGGKGKIRRGEKEGSRERDGARNEAETSDFQVSKNHQVSKSLKAMVFKLFDPITPFL